MKRRLFAAVLVLALMAGLCPTVLAADKLSTPTELGWGWEHDLADQIFWNFGENTMSIVRIVIYKDDQKLAQTEIDYKEELSNILMSDHLSYLLADEDLSMDSGVYHFTVQNIANLNADSDDDSDVAVSSKWSYTAPDAQVTPPTDPVWDFPYHTWRRGTDAELQPALLQLYFCESEDGDYQIVSTSYCDIGAATVRLPTDTWALEEYGAGYYKFRVFNLSSDVAQTRHSPWTAYSEAYHYDGGPVDICDHPNDIIQDEKAPTCTEPGYSGNSYCTECGELLLYGKTIPALGHKPDADGVCQRCGQRTLGEGGELTWTYRAETGEVAFSGLIPDGETVFVACYEEGRFTGVKAATSGSSTVEVGTDSDQLRLFWLNGGHAPKCRDVSLTLEP